ncbi:MAG TPA: tetratricopeptide repeat protein [Gemmatimonadaceae bacterium]|nr:tetratricopeptide repeat protein [Gemmatimonadaceae bacterium]
MSPPPLSTKRPNTAEARRLTELALAAGLGHAPDDAVEWHRQAAILLGTDEETPLLADVLRWQGSVLRDRGRTSDAEPLYHRSLDIATKLGYEAGQAHALNCLASLAQRRGNIVQTGNLLTDAFALADRCGEKRLAGMVQQNLGIVADIRGNPAAALAHYRVSLRTFESTNDLQQMCWVLNNLGYLYVKEERFGEAAEAFDRAAGIARARGDLMSEGIIEENRAELQLIIGETGVAYVSLRRALEIAEQRGDDVRRSAALKQRGAYERLVGRPADAVEILRRALTLSAAGEDALLGAEILYQLGMALDATGDIKGARDQWRSALEAFERMAARRWVGRVRQRLNHGGANRYV